MLPYPFSEPGLGKLLNQLGDAELDTFPFGIVKMDLTGKILFYNQAESKIAGVAAEQAIGKHFFTQVAPCTNNFLVATRYGETSLDEELDYIFTYVMTPTRVRLRLLRAFGSPFQYLLVKPA